VLASKAPRPVYPWLSPLGARAAPIPATDQAGAKPAYGQACCKPAHGKNPLRVKTSSQWPRWASPRGSSCRLWCQEVAPAALSDRAGECRPSFPVSRRLVASLPLVAGPSYGDKSHPFRATGLPIGAELPSVAGRLLWWQAIVWSRPSSFDRPARGAGSLHTCGSGPGRERFLEP